MSGVYWEAPASSITDEDGICLDGTGVVGMVRVVLHADHLAELERERVKAEQMTAVSVGAAVMAALAECAVEVVRVDSFTDIAGHFLKDRDEVEEAIRGVYRKWETALPDLVERDQRVRVETLREVWAAVNREQAWSLSDAQMQTKCLAAIDRLIDATATPLEVDGT
jgi:hypothetical protein